MPPDDLPIPGPADDTSGAKPETCDRKRPARQTGPESEVRGGRQSPGDRPLEQQRRDEAEGR